ncbi:hypothetical protein RGQ29_023372 [Quercus rubra]|uniref:DNA/RNA helicase protein n=1 Tax=Quercus rubra TaxID=3512 RepID=A0AAN7IQU9_QUERU|nr:hypothetical protein RGQ29_023372 [Quercus rubra]
MEPKPMDDIDGTLQNPGLSAPPITVKRTVTSTGARITTQIKEDGSEDSEEVKPVKSLVGDEVEDKVVVSENVCSDCLAASVEGVKSSRTRFEEFIKANKKIVSEEECLKIESKEEPQVNRVKEEPDVGFDDKKKPEDSASNRPLVPEKSVEAKVPSVPETSVKNMPYQEWLQFRGYAKSSGEGTNSHEKKVKPEGLETARLANESKANVRVREEPRLFAENKVNVKEESVRSSFWSKPQKVKKEKVEEQRVSAGLVEDGDFPEDPDWFLVGRTLVTALSTTKGRKLVDNEIVHFTFPSPNSRYNMQWIVRFSTKRSGEIGRLPMEWAKCVVPLVCSNKVKVLGRCVAAPANLSLMQEIMLYVSFYIHHSIFSDWDKSSWRLDGCRSIDSTVYPLLTLFNLLKNKPFQKADFTPAELDSRKRLLNLEGDSEEAASMLPIVKRRKGCQQFPEQNKDEQTITESSLNKLMGAAEVYNLEEMEPPNTLLCDLRPYQKQALYWMSKLEQGIDVEKAAETLHPCWSAYRICDGRASSIYVNVFSGEATTKFPTATQMARGGILADAMGLGKTVMTIALILARRGRGCPDNEELDTETVDNAQITKKRKIDSHINISSKAKGGTLIVCPMALLGQWKDELETHSEPESISIFVHYGGDRTNNPKVIAEHDVVLTTYGVLTAAYKSDAEDSIFHKVSWYRVVLDEAHTIKCWKTLGAQAACALSSCCRWCLTGTPLQNNLEDLYSLLCFLHVEPWCNWAWWNKLIQKPYENGDPRAMKLIKAILRPLMLRRTKETKDKEGRPILVLPPTDIQIIECEQSEAEHDFYDALFRKSKVQFDQFVAQGKVLHNFANILELLLRLRQCCNHPFLVMSRADSQKYTDLNKLAKRFLETNTDSGTNQTVPTRAYIEEVVEGIRRGENMECPICMEFADDPVLTPCAHRMCRECLLSSWRTPTSGLCPICRQLLKKTELITCPTENQFRVDVENNWKESSKVSKLLDCLEQICESGSGEKSIVFSQWTSFLDLLEIPLKRRGVGFLRFDGKLVQKQRERVLKEFSETKDKMVLLMSLKAGGVGLNLTAASHVFLMDPWWNPAVEEQAIMRIHRIGQKRTVRVRRFIVRDTVEERMQQVQARKQRMIAGALTEEEVRMARIEELKMLFR